VETQNQDSGRLPRIEIETSEHSHFLAEECRSSIYGKENRSAGLTLRTHIAGNTWHLVSAQTQTQTQRQTQAQGGGGVRARRRERCAASFVWAV